MSQIVLYSLAYNDSLHEYYQKLHHLPGFVLLESTDRFHGRYDILSAYPYDFIEIDQNTHDLPRLLKRISQILSPVASVADLPFQGGALGYVSYDLGAKLLGINSRIQPTLQYMPLLDFGLYDWAIIVDHHQKK